MADVYYFYLSSEDSTRIHPRNAPLDFTVELPVPLYLEGTWEVALLDIDFDDWLNDLYVFCDWCTESVFRETKQPVLRRVPRFGLDSVPHYVPLNRNYLDRVHIYIKDFDLSDSSFIEKPTTCTLQLRKCRP